MTIPVRSPSMMGLSRFSVTDALKPNAETLRYVVLVALFSWARESESRRYGWWAQDLARTDGTQFGSLLWKAQRAKILAQTLSQLRGYMESALSYLTTQRIAELVEVSVGHNDGRVEATVTVTQGNTQTDVTFSDLWAVLNGS